MLGVHVYGVLGVDVGAVQAKERKADREEESVISVRYGDGRRGRPSYGRLSFLIEVV